MRLYDTARLSVVPFEPRAGRAGLYVCGITPYDSAHLGHAFTYHAFDVLVRRLRATGTRVESVRNVTDVDDDILRVARERHLDPMALAGSQVELFERSMRDLGILAVDTMPRASEHVAEMVPWIERLVNAGCAYPVDGWVYFETARYPAYGRLSRLDAGAMISLSRERGGDPDDPRKRGPLDFVLWQPSAPGEPRWSSPWSEGRPGWHIECSVLSTAALGTPIDIHGGGDDLIYPHHESEIAQAEAANVRPYVRHWVHVAMVRHRGEKMSKSLGNLVFVHDLLARYAASTVRILLASHHYRQSWTYDARELGTADDRRRCYADAMGTGAILEAGEAARFEAAFAERIDDDLDTPGALLVLDGLAQRLLQAVTAPAGAQGVGGDELMSRLLDALGSRATSLAT